MNRSQKNLAVGIGAFLLVFVVSVVYAATSGVLTFSGTAKFSPITNLDIVDATVRSEKVGEGATVSNGQNDLDFTILFDEPNEVRYIDFKITNVGNTDAVLGSLSKEEPTLAGLNVLWPTLDGVVLAPGATSATYTITVTWQSDFDNADPMDFGATINYMKNN